MTDVRRISDGHPSWLAVDDSHVLQVSGGGAGSKLSDIVLTDDSATEFIARDDGTTITYVTLAGAPYVPTTNVRTKAVASAQLPSTLGSKTGAESLSVVPASDGVFTISAPNVLVGPTDVKTAAATVTNLAGGLSTLGIQLTGDGTGFHITPEASMDGGATWIAVGVIASGAGATSASISDITAIGNYLFSSGGYDHFRLRTVTGITGGSTLAAAINSTYANKLIRSAGIGDQADLAATSDTATASQIALQKRSLQKQTTLVATDAFGNITRLAGEGSAIGMTSLASSTLRSEQGIGALVPWNDKLYFSTYNAAASSGSGGYVGYIDKSRNVVHLYEHDCCHTGRFVHKETNQLVIGPCVFELDGTQHNIAALKSLRVSGWCRHHASPTTKVTCVTMEGDCWELDLTTYTAVKLTATTIPVQLTATTFIHYKAIWYDTNGSRYIAVSNGQFPNGRIAASADGATWTSKDAAGCSWNEVTGTLSAASGNFVFLVGNDHKSALFGVMALNDGQVYKYRMPRHTRALDYYITQEWPRIRTVQTERLMMQAFGTWYNVSPWLAHIAGPGGSLGVVNAGTPGTDYPIIEPVGLTLRTVNDWTMFDGKFVVGSNEASEQQGFWPLAGQSSGAVTFGDLDDILKTSKPTGDGHFWWRESITNDVKSDPMLVRGYDKKSLHFFNNTATATNITIWIVKLGIGQAALPAKYSQTPLALTASDYTTFQFPDGWAADWIMISSSASVTDITAWIECR